MRFQGKVAVVTGASSGMGLATAKQLAREGARVVIVARGVEGLEAAAVAIRSAGALLEFSVASGSRMGRQIANSQDCFQECFWLSEC